MYKHKLIYRQMSDRRPMWTRQWNEKRKKERIDFETGIGIGDSGFRVYTLHLHVLQWRHAAIKSMSMQATISRQTNLVLLAPTFI
jgi:hypothetical protein